MVRLLKALYGCHQSGKLWYARFTAFLQEMNFVANKAKRCVWNLMRNNAQITVGFHVDDNLVTSESQENLGWFLAAMKKEFKGVRVHAGLFLLCLVCWWIKVIQMKLIYL